MAIEDLLDLCRDLVDRLLRTNGFVAAVGAAALRVEQPLGVPGTNSTTR